MATQNEEDAKYRDIFDAMQWPSIARAVHCLTVLPFIPPVHTCHIGVVKGSYYGGIRVVSGSY